MNFEASVMTLLPALAHVGSRFRDRNAAASLVQNKKPHPAGSPDGECS